MKNKFTDNIIGIFDELSSSLTETVSVLHEAENTNKYGLESNDGEPSSGDNQDPTQPTEREPFTMDSGHDNMGEDGMSPDSTEEFGDPQPDEFGDGEGFGGEGEMSEEEEESKFKILELTPQQQKLSMLRLMKTMEEFIQNIKVTIEVIEEYDSQKPEAMVAMKELTAAIYSLRDDTYLFVEMKLNPNKPYDESAKSATLLMMRYYNIVEALKVVKAECEKEED